MEKNNKKVVLITGAASGFGFDALQRFLYKGYKVIGTDKNEINYTHENLEKYIMDVRNDKQVKDVISKVLKKENIDVLVNNAGYGMIGSIENQDLNEVRDMYEVNVFGLIKVSKMVIPHMRERRSGKIINLSSGAGFMSTEFLGYYCGTKFAVEAINRAMYSELKHFGVSVTSITPEGHKTNFPKVQIPYFKNDKGSEYEKVFKKFLPYFEDSFKKDAKPVGKAIVKAADSKKMRISPTRTISFLIFLQRFLSLRMLSRIVRSVTTTRSSRKTFKKEIKK